MKFRDRLLGVSFKLTAVLSAFFAFSLFISLFLNPSVAEAAGPQEDLAAANVIVKRAIVAVQADDFARAIQEYKSYENMWFEIEDGIRGVSRESYHLIEEHMGSANSALSSPSANRDSILTALNALDAQQDRFIYS